MTFRDYTFGYKILGQGLTSTVYKAKKNKSKQQFALKVIRQEFLKSDFELKLLQNEITIHETLSNHKNFVKLYEHGKYQNSYVFVMEICQKGSLGQFLEKNHSLTEIQSVYIITELISAYKVLYQLKILHRDIKPGNILLTQKNQVKLSDFGLSVQLCESHHAKNYRIGTPCFMAPQVAQKIQFTPKSDIWSIGVTYFTMLTGQLPYKCQNYDNFLKQIDQVKLQTIIPHYISDFSKFFLLKTLQKDPEKRMCPEQLFSYKFESTRIMKSLKSAEQKKEKPKNKTVQYQKKKPTKNQLSTSQNFDINNKADKNLQRSQQTESSQTNLKQIVENKNDKKSSKSPTTLRTPRFSKSIQKLSNSKPKRISVSPLKKLSPNKNKQKIIKKQQEKILMKEMQKITKILINQIDFLRYTVKIINSLDKYFKRQFIQLKQMMNHFICVKIQELKNLDFIEKAKIKSYQNYQIYNQWTQLIEDYERSLNFSEKGRFNYEEFQQNLSKTILEIFLEFDKTIKTKSNAQRLVTLDHLICYRDLLQMGKKGEIYFLKNSMLNLILQGMQKIKIQYDQIEQVYMGITKKITGSDYS